MLDRTGFLECNKATLDVLGCPSKDQFVSKHPSEFLPPKQPEGKDSLTAARECIEVADAEGGQFFEWLHKRLDETVFPAAGLLGRLQLQRKTVLQCVGRYITTRQVPQVKGIDLLALPFHPAGANG